MKHICLLPAMALISSCATMDDSLKLGAAMGAVTGGTATYVGYEAGGTKANLGNIAVGAGIGIGLGLITSYFTHKEVEDHRQSFQAEQIEMHFGDLPPSPFVIPKKQEKKASKR